MFVRKVLSLLEKVDGRDNVNFVYEIDLFLEIFYFTVLCIPVNHISSFTLVFPCTPYLTMLVSYVDHDACMCIMLYVMNLIVLASTCQYICEELISVLLFYSF